MIWHQTVGEHAPTGSHADLAQRIHKEGAIFIGQKNFLPAISTIHDVINRARILHAQFSSHRIASVYQRNGRSQGEKRGTDPFAFAENLKAES